MFQKLHYSNHTREAIPGQALDRWGKKHESQNLRKTQTHGAGDVLPRNVSVKWFNTGEPAARKARRLSCLSLSGRLPSEKFNHSTVQEDATRVNTLHTNANELGSVIRENSWETRETNVHLGKPLSGVLRSIKAWLRSSQGELKFHDTPPSESVVPIRTSRHYPLPANGSGAAARQSAAARNSLLSQGQIDDPFELFPEYPPSYQKIDPRFSLLGRSLTQDVESGVNLEKNQHTTEDKENMHLVICKGMCLYSLEVPSC